MTSPPAPGSFSSDRPARIAVLISGRGSNMIRLADACADAAYPAQLELVLADKEDAPGLAAAAERGLETAAITKRSGESKTEHEQRIDDALRARRIDLICLAGYMRILSPYLIDRWPGRILNIHPSLLPLFKGLDTHARALAAGVKLHGATVHVVTPALDGGPILAQAAIAVREDDTPESLSARLLPVEHALYAEALASFASGHPMRNRAPSSAVFGPEAEG